MKLIIKLFLICFIICQSAYAQGGARSCAALQANPSAYQSCATNVPFANQTTSNSESIIPACFRAPPQAPTWFFMQINASGTINLQIAQTSNLGNPIDVDFAIWGPFATLNNICPQLVNTNLVDCSWEPDAVENVTISNAVNGQYYILMVDNYAQRPGQITISQTAGTGRSDCGFLSSVAIKDTSNNEITQKNYCKPDTKDLKAIVDITDFTANPANLRFNYRWTKDGIVVATISNSTSNTNVFNATATGLYKVEMAAYDSSDPLVNINNIPFPTEQSDEISLTFFDKPILSATPVNILQCDLVAPNNNGFTTFNLTQAYNDITNGATGILLRYYLDAGLTQLIPQPLTFTNTVATSQTIYVVGDFGQSFYCPSNTATLRLTVSPTSLAVYPDVATVCPQLNENFGLIDFTSQRTEIKNLFFPSANVTIQFYANMTDASLEQNELTNISRLPLGIKAIYTKIKSGVNCSNVGSFFIEVKAVPIRNTISDVVLCRNDNFTLLAKDAESLLGQVENTTITYHLNQNDAVSGSNPINKNTTFIGNLGASTIVARIVLNRTQCFITVPFTITTFPNPTVNATPTPYRVCGNTIGSFDLTTQNTNLVGTNSYAISFYETQVDYNNNNAIPNPQSYVSLPKTIFIKAVDITNNNCASQTSLELQVEPKPGSNVNPAPFLKCNSSGFAAFNLKTKELEMTGAGNVNDLLFKYYQNLSDAEANANNAIVIPTNFTNTFKNYQRIFVRISNVDLSKICVSILYIDLYVGEFPANNLDTNPYKICKNNDDIVITEAKIDTKLVPETYSFIWYNGHNAVAGNEITGQTSASFSTATAAKYSVKITNFTTPANCQTVVNFSTKVLTTPTSISVLPDEIIAFHEANIITVSALPQSLEYEYQLNDGTWQDSNIIEGLKPGVNIVRARNKSGCDSVETEVILADFRRFFTPNGDGYNDYWKIDGDNALDISTTFIFDRFGRILYQYQQSGEGWNGTYNGQQLPADDYWFRILYKNNGLLSEIKGHFALKR